MTKRSRVDVLDSQIVEDAIRRKRHRDAVRYVQEMEKTDEELAEEYYQSLKYTLWKDIVEDNCRVLYLVVRRVMRHCREIICTLLEHIMWDLLCDEELLDDIQLWVSPMEDNWGIIPNVILGSRKWSDDACAYTDISMDVTPGIEKLAEEIAKFLEQNHNIFQVGTEKRISACYGLNPNCPKDRVTIEKFKEKTCDLLRRCKNLGFRLPQ